MSYIWISNVTFKFVEENKTLSHKIKILKKIKIEKQNIKELSE